MLFASKLFTERDVFTSWEMLLNVSRNMLKMKCRCGVKKCVFGHKPPRNNNEQIKEWKAQSLINKESIVKLKVCSKRSQLPPSQFLSSSQTIIPNLGDISAIRLKSSSGECVLRCDVLHQRRSTFDKTDLSCRLRSSDLRTLRTLSLCFRTYEQS